MKAPNFKQLAVAASISVAMGMSGAASAAAIDTIVIDSFGFGMGQAPNANDTQSPQINMDITMGTFQGGPNFDTTSGDADKSAGIVGFDFGFFGPVSAYTSPDKLNDPLNPQLGIYSAPSGDITGTSMTLNLESWTAGWNGNEFNQGGSTSGTMTISNLTDLGGGQYSFTADWSTLIEGGPFNGRTGYWTMDGTASVSAVPVPAAVWLMGSGLLGLVGVARRRKVA